MTDLYYSQDWLAEKLNRGYLKDTVAYVEKQEDFDNVDPTKTEFVMGRCSYVSTRDSYTI